jgi:hypothetical protein
MKLKFIFLIILFLLQYPMQAQVDSLSKQFDINGINSNFVYLYSNQLFLTNYLDLKEDPQPYNPPNLFTDSSSYPLHRVKFYQIENIIFANVSLLVPCPNNNCFAIKVNGSKVNIFEYYKSTLAVPVKNSNSVVALAMVSGINMSDKGKVDRYYNMGTGDIKKIDYKNLKIDLKQNNGSMQNLQSSQRAFNLKGSFIAIGALSIASGVIGYIASNPNGTSQISPQTIKGLKYQNFIVASFGISISSFLIAGHYNKKERLFLFEAINVYNN